VWTQFCRKPHGTPAKGPEEEEGEEEEAPRAERLRRRRGFAPAADPDRPAFLPLSFSAAADHDVSCAETD
jgi:hypothetical protein